VELTPGVVTILPAWKLDAVYCAGLKVGAPQVSLSALCALHELLAACESRLGAQADWNVVDALMMTISSLSRAAEQALPGPLELP
jgi:hypothetical protein